MAVMFAKPGGTFVAPYELWPQAATVPSAVTARLWLNPAATASTFDNPAGALVCPSYLRPQVATVPSAFNARLW